jgi:glyoxylase-like metal-dependent hydrolase (beta-lactamase superfamily II)
MNEVITGLYQLNNQFVNLYLIVEHDGLTLIDAGIARSGAKLVLKTIDELGKQPGDLKRILITHADPDHYGSALALKQATGARIFASSKEAAAMTKGASSREMKGNAIVQALFGLFNKLMPMTPTPVDEIIAPGQTLPILDGLQVIASPGHTPDHISFYASAHKLLIAGDSLNATGGKLRFVDGPVTWDYQRGLQSVREQAALHPALVAVGHGPVISKSGGLLLSQATS